MRPNEIAYVTVNLKHIFRRLVASIFFLVGLQTSNIARAALLAHEPFTNAPGTAIIGSGDGFGFNGVWQSNSSQGTTTNTGYGLSYTDGASHTLVTVGGAGFFQGLTTANNNMQPIRLFDFSRGTNGTDGVTTWISFLVARQGPTGTLSGNPFGRGANVPHDLNTGALQKLAIGNGSGAGSNTVALIPQGNAANIRGATNLFGGVTNFVVVRVDHVWGGNDVAYLFVNPTLGVEPLTSAAGAVSSNSFDFSFDRLRVFAGGQSSAAQPYAEMIVDEYRLGETYADVTPYGNAPHPQPLLITNVQIASGNLVLSGTGGTGGGTYHLLANANLTTASNDWPAVATNTFDATGGFALTNPIGAGEKFYRLRIPGAPAPVGPSIVIGPVSLTVTQGQTAAFSVTADGTVPLNYQWYFNTSTLLSGQTASNFSIANAQAANAGAYSVRVSNAGGNITSTQATLTVLLPPAITTQPQSQTVTESNNVTFTVVATGTPTLLYQWYFNTNTPLADKTNASLNLTSVTTNDAGKYSVVVSNAFGSTNSALATLTVNVPSTNGDYYVSPTGNDANPGTLAAPFATLNKAQSVAQPGNIIYMRGGTYLPSETIRITNSGTVGNPIQLLAYSGETPYLNFSNQPYADANRGILFPTTANYWTVKGLEIGYAGDNGIKVEGSHHRFEQCVFHHNGDTGLQIGFGHTNVNPGGQFAAYIEVVNCDSYLNYDPNSSGGDADGFAAKMHCGQGIVFTGCRAWENSDDGWDLFETDYSVVISNCWTWKSAFVGQGNGNGFKMGGNGSGGDSKGTHYAYNCVAFAHKVNGFTQNSHKDGDVVINCLSFTNGASGYNYFFEGSLNSGKQNVFKNNVGILRKASSPSNNFSEDNGPLEQNNSWNLTVTPDANDYVSILEAAAKAARQADGSLPAGFARLVSGSDLIDQGVNVGLPFNGTAPDLGPCEYSP
jgi:hypothetical protein